MNTLLPTLEIWKKKLASIEDFYIPRYEGQISAEFIKSFIQKVKNRRLQVISWGLYFYHLQEIESTCVNHKTKQGYCSNALSKCLPMHIIAYQLVFHLTEGYLTLFAFCSLRLFVVCHIYSPCTMIDASGTPRLSTMRQLMHIQLWFPAEGIFSHWLYRVFLHYEFSGV